MPEHCRTCQRALDSRWAWEDGRPVRVVACPRCARVGRIHAGQRFGAVFQQRGPDRLGTQDGQRVVADGGVSHGGTLRLTDEGIEMPEMLKGYVGQFEIKTAKITAQFNTTEEGLSDEDFSDQIWGTYPEGGDYNERLSDGEMIIQARGYEAMKYDVVDDRSEGGDAE